MMVKKTNKNQKKKEESRNDMVQTLTIAMEVVRTDNSRCAAWEEKR